ncbi:Microspherule protein 1 [Senna tora]|uniref:Microspherule protein 1 n=1 Tax=Senna tora TaxID=362788 RepID=A0A834T9L5_9FABA|nr:Microspherule protein 1 [Senna tora]
MGALATLAFWTPEDDLLLKNAVEDLELSVCGVPYFSRLSSGSWKNVNIGCGSDYQKCGGLNMHRMKHLVAGASLESLAKGAVQFSDKKTVQEIKDRWYTLLYDPIISAEASACMSNFKFSASSLPSKFSKLKRLKERKFPSVKRKAESIRSSYYAKRKRICSDKFTSMDLSLMVGQRKSIQVGNGDPLTENCMPDFAHTNGSGFQGKNCDPMHCVFPGSMMDGSVHALESGVENQVEESFSIKQINIVKEEPQILGDNVSLNGVEELGGPQELPLDNLIADSSLDRMHLSTFDQIDIDPGNLYSEFDGNHIFDSPDLNCGTSFNILQLSPLPEMPIWRTDVSIQEPDVPCDDLNIIACEDAYLAELSNSLLDFASEEELYLVDVDGNDGFDKSYYDGLNSVLLNSPNEISPDQIPRITESETTVPSQQHDTNQSAFCHGEIDNIMGLYSSDLVGCKSEVQIPSFASAKDRQFPELTNGVICCTLNTEDPEIPSNDDVFLPFGVSSSIVPSFSKKTFQQASKPVSSSVEGFGPGHRAGQIGKSLVRAEQETPGDSHVSSHRMGSSPLPRSVAGSKVKHEMPNSHALNTMPRTAVIVSGGSTVDHSVREKSKEESTDMAFAKHLSNDPISSSNEEPAHGSNNCRNYPHSNASTMKQEPDVAIPIQDHQLLHGELGSSEVMRSEMVENTPTSAKEEQYLDSDDEIPNYSDIEAMVLDMDLDPDDQDLYCSEEEGKPTMDQQPN